MASTEYTTGDIDFKVRVTNEKDVTVDYVVNEANQMWREIRSRKLKFGDMDAADAVMNEMRKKHPQFCKSYPIVLRYMCQMQEYDHRAFRNYLMKIKEHPYTNETEYLDSQADYVVILYKQRNSRWNCTQVSNLRKNVRGLLQREHDVFKSYVEEFDKEVSAETEKLKEKGTAELHEFVQIVGPEGMKAAGTIRVETDLISGMSVDVDTIAANVNVELTSARADDLLAD